MDAPIPLVAPEGVQHYITAVKRYYATGPDGTALVDAHDVDELRRAGWRYQIMPRDIAPGAMLTEAPLPAESPAQAVEPTPELAPEPAPADPAV